MYDYRLDHLEVAAGQTDADLGDVGARGDILERLVISVATSLTSNVSIKDGNGSAIPILAINTPLGVYSIKIGAVAKAATTPGWKVTTGAGASVMAIGKFT